MTLKTCKTCNNKLIIKKYTILYCLICYNQINKKLINKKQKQCRYCNNIKDILEYPKSGGNCCKICKVKQTIKPKKRNSTNIYIQSNTEHKMSFNEYFTERDKLLSDNKQRCNKCLIIKDNNNINFRKYRFTCRQCSRERNNYYAKTNEGKRQRQLWKEKNPNYKKEESKRRYADPLKRLIHNYRTRLRCIIKKKYKSSKYVDCSWKFLHKYINYYLEEFPDFNLDNYGPDWHIDHVIPLARLDLADENNRWVMKWFNLAPLSKEDNITKGDNIWVSQLKHHKQVLQKFIEKEKIINNDINNLFEYMAKHLDAGTS